MSRSAVVVGAGLAGLTAAWRLRDAGWSVDVVDAADRPGGVVGSWRDAGFLAEAGPNSMATRDPRVLGLLGELGLADEIVGPAPAGRRRYVVRDGRLVALPTCPRTFLATPILSAATKARVLSEPFRRGPAAPDRETVEAFFLRRGFGRQFVDRVVNPFVAGVFAADPAALSIRHALPRLHALEAEHGSVVRGMVRAIRARRAANGGGDGGAANEKGAAAGGHPFFSFRDGMGRLPDALATSLAGHLRCGRAVRSIRRDASGWSVGLAGGPAETLTADAVIWAAPAHAADRIELAGIHGDPRPALRRIRHAPLAVYTLGYARRHVSHPLDGFGVLAPAEEGRTVLGALFTSSLFPGRAPFGHVLLTAFVGGMRDPWMATRPADQGEIAVRADLAELLGISGEPTWRRHVAWPHAIPQYGLDHGQVLSDIEDVEAANPGLRFAGSWRAGVSTADTMLSGWNAAEAIAATPDRASVADAFAPAGAPIAVVGAG